MPSTNTLRTLTRIVQEFRVIEPDLPASYASIILFVAKAERDTGNGATIRDICSGLGMISPSVSRATLALSSRRLGGTKATEERPQGGRKALGVLNREADEFDLRSIRCTLSDKGRALIARLEGHLED